MDQQSERSNSRRDFFKQTAAVTAGLAIASITRADNPDWDEQLAKPFEEQQLNVEINGKQIKVSVEPRTTVLDLLREQLHLTGTKKGCDWGQCGACTIHIDGKRVLSCMSLAVMQNGKKITTIEGIGTEENLHPMQEAFIKHDGFQCGYCTPGQIMSGIACVKEGNAHTNDNIRESMSGNLCRCGAYDNIIRAIADVQSQFVIQ